MRLQDAGLAVILCFFLLLGSCAANQKLDRIMSKVCPEPHKVSCPLLDDKPDTP